MPQQVLEKRVDILEQTVEALVGLPARVEAVEGQIVQLRSEMRSEFSAIREEIRTGDEQTRRHASVLHEDAVAQIKVIAEGHETTQGHVRVLREEFTAFRDDMMTFRLSVMAFQKELHKSLEKGLMAAQKDVRAFRKDVTARLKVMGGQLARRPRKRTH